jgi:hypothetical protein
VGGGATGDSSSAAAAPTRSHTRSHRRLPAPQPHARNRAGYCPTGDDPLTLCASTDVNSYQELRFALGSAVKWSPTATSYTPGTYAATDETMDYFGTGTFTPGGPLVDQLAARAAAPGQMRVTYTDQFGGRYTAHAATNAFVSAAADAAANDALEAVLESLPEKKVKNVNVASKLTTAADAANPGLAGVLERRYVVTFVPDAANSANVGQQAPLGCDTGYSCTEAGCQPMVAMPFLYRYGGMAADVPIGTTLTNIGSAGAGHIAFYTGDRNTADDWADGQFVRVHASSQPQMPFNVPVDVGTSTGAPTTARYDVRILVAVVDPANSLNDDNDIAYVRVTAGHTNISSNMEAVGYAGWPSAPVATGVWGATSGTTPKPWTTTLTGFTPLGPIVADAAGVFKMAVPGAPGVWLHFPKADIVQSDGKGRWYEVLLKLPHCSVTVLEADGQFAGVDGSTLNAIDAQVENAECSNRGACDRTSGRCACFEGYYGPACSKQTILV